MNERSERRHFAIVSLRAALLGAAVLFSAGCGSGSGTLAAVDPNAAPLHPFYEDVEPILQKNCVPCHKGTGAGSGGFEEGRQRYEDCAGARADTRGITQTVLEAGSMPPGAWPRLTEREKLILERWIVDGAPCAP